MGTSCLPHSGDKGHLVASWLPAPLALLSMQGQQTQTFTCPHPIPSHRRANPWLVEGVTALCFPQPHIPPLCAEPHSLACSSLHQVSSAFSVLLPLIFPNNIIIYYTYNNVFSVRGWLSRWQRLAVGMKAWSLLPLFRETNWFRGIPVCVKVKQISAWLEQDSWKLQPQLLGGKK